MTLTIACRDLGKDCPFVARGETTDEVLTDLVKHAKTAHGFTDEQVKDPKLAEAAKAAIKKE